MSDKIDQRIVEMSFENQKFEKGILQSKNSLKDFSKMLDKGFDKDLSGLEKSVGAISSSFSILEQIGIGALRRIGEMAVDTGVRMIKSLSVDQLTAGWSKYEEKLDAVQTLISAGYDMDSVRKELDQLMWFADETSYSFSDMANNMGKFVAAGVDLNTSSKAMQGIATWAAQSGKNSQAASIAMFNLSQAISMGYVDTLNWRSIMNQNLNTKMFKQVAIGVAEATGAIKKGSVTIQNFDSNLKTKWFTNDVLLKTLDQYSAYAEKVRQVQEEMNFDTAAQAMAYIDSHADQYADVVNQIGNAAFKASQESKKFSDSINATMDAVSSGWLRTYEIIFGELDEAKANFTALTEILWTVFASGAENRNEMLRWLKEAGGISNVFQGFKNIAVALLSVLKPIAQAFDQIFPPKTREQWLGMTETFKNFTKSLIITEEVADKVRRTFAGFFAVVDIGWQVLKFLAQAAFEVVKIFLPLGGTFLSASASLGDFLVRVNQMIKSSQFFQYALLAVKIAVVLIRENLGKLISTVSEFVSGLWHAEKPLEYLKDAGKRAFSGLVEWIKIVISWISGGLKKAINGIASVFNGTFDTSKTGIWPTMLTLLKDFVNFIGGEAVKGFKNFGDVIKNLDFNKIATFVVGGVLLIFVKQLSDLTGAMTGFTNAVTGAINGFTKKFLGTKTTSLIRDMAYALGILTASIWVLSTIPTENLNKSLIGLAKAIGIFVLAYGLILGIQVAASKLMKDTKMVSSAFGLTGVAAALLIMATAVKTISKIDPSQVWNSVAVITAMLGLLTAYQVLSTLISKIPGQRKVTLNLFGLSLSILTLVGALSLLKLFSETTLKASLSKLASVLLVIGAIQSVFAFAARIGGGNKVSTSILSMAVGIAALVGTIKLISLLEQSTISKGLKNLTIISLLIFGIEVMMGLASRVGGGNKLKSNMLSVQLGMLSMVALIAILSAMDQGDIERGIVSLAKMAGIVGGIELLTAVSARIAGGAKLQKTLGSISLTLFAFAGIIAILGYMKQPLIDQGILALAKMIGLVSTLIIVASLASKLSSGVDKDGNLITNKSGVFTSLLGAIVAIITLTGALALLSLIPEEDLRGASTSLVIASAAILLLSVSFEKISNAMNLISKGSQGFADKVKNIGLALVALGALLLATIVFFGTLALVQPLISDVTTKNMAVFIMGLGAITALLIVLDRLPMNDSDNKKRLSSLIPGFIALAGILLGTIGFFYVLKQVLTTVKDVEFRDIAIFTIGLGVVTILLSAMASLSKVFAAAGNLGFSVLGGVISSIITLGLVVLAVVGLAELLNWMISDADTLTRGLDLLVLVGAGIGRFIGSIAGGLVGGVLEGIGYSLAAFVESLSGFSPDSLQGIKALAEAILIITATSIIDGISSFFSFGGKTPMDKFGEQIKSLVDAFQSIGPDQAEKASNSLAAMTPMAHNLREFATVAKEIPNSGGLFGQIFGENDIKTFGLQLRDLVGAFTVVTPALAKLASDALQEMTPMAKNLKEFAITAQNIPNTGGFIAEYLGDNDIKTFGSQVRDLAGIFTIVTPDMAKLAANALEEMTPMADNLKKFANVAQGIPNSGGDFITFFLGDNDLATFGEQVKGLIDTFGGINEATLNLAITSLVDMTNRMLPALVKFSEFSNGLKNSGGLAQLFTGNTTLSEFGTELKKFIEKLSTVDFTVVASAMDAMSRISISFQTMGADVIENAKRSFENNKEPFQKSIATILDGPLEALNAKKDTLGNLVTSIFSAVTSKGNLYIKEFKKLGMDLVDGLKNGVESKKVTAVSAVRNVMTSIVSEAKKVVDAHSPSRVFETIGGWCTKGLANGLRKETNVAVQAGIQMAKITEEGIRDELGVHSLSEKFSNIGGWLPKSIGEGIQNGKSSLLDTATKLGIDTSNFTIDGFTSAIAGKESGATSTINSLLDLLTGTSSSTATSTGSDLGNSLTSGFQNALSNSSTGLGGSGTKATVKSELDKLKAVIDERSFYGTITIEQELEMYQKLRSAYKAGSEERKQIDREIYTRLKTIYEAQISYIEGAQKAQKDAAEERAKLEDDYAKNVANAEAEANKKLLDLRKKYDEDVAKANLTANQKLESQDKSYYNNLNSILDNAEKERQRLREQYASNQKSINSKLLSDIDAQNKAYENAVKSRADSIYNSYNLFSAVDEDAEITGEELLKNLQDQGAAFSEWKQSLADLANRGVGNPLIEELQAMGPSTKAQIKALLSLTDEQLTEYVGLFEGKYAFARTKAEEELEGLKNSTIQTIKDLNSQAAIDLDELEKEFNSAMSTINNNMATDMEELRKTHEEALAEINNDLREKLMELESNWSQSSSEIQADLVDKLNELKSSYNEGLTKINSDLKKNLDEMKTKFSTTMKEIVGLSESELKKLIADNKTKLSQLNFDTGASLGSIEKTYEQSGDKIVSSFGSAVKGLIPNTASTLNSLSGTVRNSFNSMISDFENSGFNAASGFARGIQNGAYQAVNAASYLARAAVRAAETILDEHSPSKVFEGIGKFVSMGFANGIVKYAQQAEQASQEMASGPISAITKALAEIDDSNDWSFTITPVLDLSNVRSMDIAQLVNTPIQLGATSQRLATEVIQNGNQEAAPIMNIVNKFDLTGLTVRSESDIDAIATKLYQKQQAASRGRGARTPIYST